MARASPAASPTTTRIDLDRRPASVDPKVGRDLGDRIRFDQITERRVNPRRVKPAAPADLGHGEPLDPKGAHDLAHGGPDQDRHALSMPPAAASSRATGCYATVAEPSSTLRSLDPGGRRRDGLRPAIEVVSSVVTLQQRFCAQIPSQLAMDLKRPCRARVAPLPEAISLRILVLQARTGRPMTRTCRRCLAVASSSRRSCA